MMVRGKERKIELLDPGFRMPGGGVSDLVSLEVVRVRGADCLVRSLVGDLGASVRRSGAWLGGWFRYIKGTGLPYLARAICPLASKGPSLQVHVHQILVGPCECIPSTARQERW